MNNWGSYDIVINNIRFDQNLFPKVNNIIKHFAKGKELFLGYYRLDGTNITKSEMLKYNVEIPMYFENHTECHQIISTSNIRDHNFGVCQISNNKKFYEMIDKIFDYYLETTLFCPRISWETFVSLYEKYLENGVKDYVLNGYTDFVLSYIDSGDFSITFDPEVYNYKYVREQINRILFDKT